MEKLNLQSNVGPLNPELSQSNLSLHEQRKPSISSISADPPIAQTGAPNRYSQVQQPSTPPRLLPHQLSNGSIHSYTQAPAPNSSESNRNSMPPSGYYGEQNRTSLPPQSNRYSVGPNPFANQYASLQQEPSSASYSSLNYKPEEYYTMPYASDFYTLPPEKALNQKSKYGSLEGSDLTECALCRHFVEIRNLKEHLDSQCKTCIVRYNNDITQKRL
jgi:hypothetical protein